MPLAVEDEQVEREPVADMWLFFGSVPRLKHKLP